MFRISGLSRKEVQYNGRRAVEEMADDEKNFSLLSFRNKQMHTERE
jgi:hypothetical protein